MAKDDTPRVHMMSSEIIRAGVLLQQHMHPIEGTPYFKYEEGWDDERIGKETAERLHAGHIERLRRSLEMKQEPKRFKSSDGEDLVKMIAAQEARLALLTEQHNKLCAAMSLNKVFDARDYELVL